MTEQRRIITQVLSESHDHPDVELLHQGAYKLDSRISIATAYRTVRLFEEAGIIESMTLARGVPATRKYVRNTTIT